MWLTASHPRLRTRAPRQMTVNILSIKTTIGLLSFARGIKCSLCNMKDASLFQSNMFFSFSILIINFLSKQIVADGINSFLDVRWLLLQTKTIKKTAR